MSLPFIRQTQLSDQLAIEDMVRQAFAASHLGHTGEADLVRELRSDGDVVLELVAEHGSEIVGHLLFSRMQVTADGQPVEAVALAPLSVMPAYQRLGIGAALIEFGHATLRRQNIALVFLVGHVDYYPRFGYWSPLARPFASPYSGPPYMACALAGSFPEPTAGVVRFAPAFERIG